MYERQISVPLEWFVYRRMEQLWLRVLGRWTARFRVTADLVLFLFLRTRKETKEECDEKQNQHSLARHLDSSPENLKSRKERSTVKRAVPELVKV